MTKILKSVLFLFLTLFLFSPFSTVLAQNEALELPEIDFFYSDTCPHCHDEMEFFKKLEINYPSLQINKYNVDDEGITELKREFAIESGVEEYLALVPMTFIDGSAIIGFNTEATTGKNIERLLLKNTPGVETVTELEVCEDSDEICEVTIPGLDKEVIDESDYTILSQNSNLDKFGIDPKKLSLPVLSIALGFFDGFNVCSLGALLLILSLVLSLKSRKKILLFGGLFILITGITYALLIFLWFTIFEMLSPFVRYLEALIGLIGILGGTWFIRQWLRWRKYGPTCESNDSKIVQNITRKIQKVFSGNKSIWVISLAVILFSFVVTIMEFPCSAVIPVAFAAILTSAGTSALMKGIYLLLFMIFYLLDELIVFIIGVVTMKIWFGGQKMTKHLALIQAFVFIALGIFYLQRLF